MFKRKLASIIIIICCLVFALKFIPHKVSYSVEMNQDGYIVSVIDIHGKLIYEEFYQLEPVVSEVGDYTVMVTAGKGDSIVFKFINGKTGRISDNFENISTYNEQLVVYGIYEDEKLKIVIRDIYDKDIIYKEITDTFPNVAVGSYIIKDAEILSDCLVHITYYTGDDWKEKDANFNIEKMKEEKMNIKVGGWDMEYTISDRQLTVGDFESIEPGSSLDEIERKFGKPDGWVGGGMLFPVYVLKDNSAVVLVFKNNDTYEELTAIYQYKDQREIVIKKR